MGFTPPNPGIIAKNIETTIASLEALPADIRERVEVQTALVAARAALAEATRTGDPSA